jgi:hypothetical protein
MSLLQLLLFPVKVSNNDNIERRQQQARETTTTFEPTRYAGAAGDEVAPAPVFESFF